MPYCSRCGVEVEEGTERCPLCSTPIQRLEEAAPPTPYPQHIIDPEDAYRLSKAERRRIGLELLSLAAALASAALLAVDLLPDGRLGWSAYAVASVVFAWYTASAPLAFYGRAKAMLGALSAGTATFLVVLDGLAGGLSWSLRLGLPILGATVVTAAACAAVMASRTRKGLNMIGIAALGVAAYLIELEAILRLGLGIAFRPYWSIVTALALVPVAVLLFFLHGRVMRGANLRKIFRL